MLTGLPTFIDPLQLAKYHSRLTGPMPLKHLLRLHDSLSEIHGEVFIDWLFTKDDRLQSLIEGHLQARLPMICQRCMQTVECEINTKVALVVLPHGHSEDDIPDGYEAFTLTPSTTLVSLMSLIEDELILALPIVPKHEECPPNEYFMTDSFTEDQVPVSNPFQELLQQCKK